MRMFWWSLPLFPWVVFEQENISGYHDKDTHSLLKVKQVHFIISEWHEQSTAAQYWAVLATVHSRWVLQWASLVTFVISQSGPALNNQPRCQPLNILWHFPSYAFQISKSFSTASSSFSYSMHFTPAWSSSAPFTQTSYDGADCVSFGTMKSISRVLPSALPLPYLQCPALH